MTNALVSSDLSINSISLTAPRNEFLNSTAFVAYDTKFFEAPCYDAKTRQLYFVERGPPGGLDGTHTWQYLLDTRNNTLRNITTNPPTTNSHGCVVFRDDFYVVTSHNETASLVRVDPKTLEKTVLLNNYYQQPFMGFNDLEIDPDGNFWVTGSKSGWVS